MSREPGKPGTPSVPAPKPGDNSPTRAAGGSSSQLPSYRNSTPNLLSVSVSRPPAALTDAPPGYQILGELGRGGAGVVYRAVDVRLGRPVALKVLLAGAHTSLGDRKRLLLEAEALARLNHPNIVQIYDVGEHRGLPFLAMEFCAGGRLTSQLSGRALPGRRAAELVEIAARAVQAAHNAGLLHGTSSPTTFC